MPESTNQQFKIVLDSAFSVHNVLGPGLLESAYQECLLYELTKAGFFEACLFPFSTSPL
ncbi:MAG: GxxExxY protein [Bacteroidales bacterium]